MTLGYTDIRNNVKGTFKRYYVKATVKRNKHTERFACFIGNTKTEYSFVKVIYCRNDKDVMEIIHTWNHFYNDNTYDYRLLNNSAIRTPILTVDEIISEYKEKNGFDFLMRYTEVNHREIIH